MQQCSNAWYMRRSIVLLSTLAIVFPIVAWAASYDVQIQRSDVTFVPTSFVVGDHVRVYATVKNVGERDVQGSVFFSENGTAIGTPPPFSVRARGAEEEVWVDWQPAVVGERQIFIRVVTAPETRDEAPTNNEMIVPVTVRDRPLPPPPPPSSQPTGTATSGGGGSGSIFGAPAGAAPSGAVAPSTPPSAAPAPAPKPKAPATGGTAVARTSDRPSVVALRPATPAVVLAPTNTAPTVAPPPASPAPPPTPPYDEQLRQLLGRPASPWRSALPIAAAGIAVAAAATMIALRIRRRAHDETPRGTSETVDRRPPRTS
ncbi:MAG: hypothetical protein Q8R16_03410 [bacterium]|nr:hypothetical protein [bacterium]